MLEKEPRLVDLICYGILVLFGEEGKHWDHYETDPDWWGVRLWTRRN